MRGTCRSSEATTDGHSIRANDCDRRQSHGRPGDDRLRAQFRRRLDVRSRVDLRCRVVRSVRGLPRRRGRGQRPLAHRRSRACPPGTSPRSSSGSRRACAATRRRRRRPADAGDVEADAVGGGDDGRGHARGIAGPVTTTAAIGGGDAAAGQTAYPSARPCHGVTGEGNEAVKARRWPAWTTGTSRRSCASSRPAFAARSRTTRSALSCGDVAAPFRPRTSITWRRTFTPCPARGSLVTS